MVTSDDYTDELETKAGVLLKRRTYAPYIYVIKKAYLCTLDLCFYSRKCSQMNQQ